MGRYRPLRLLLGGTVAAAAVWLGAQGGGHGHAAAAPPRVEGSVSPAGVGWGAAVDHLDVGRYRIGLDDVDVVTWDGLADVVIVPLGGRATEVRFLRSGVPVDAGFTYTALAR